MQAGILRHVKWASAIALVLACAGVAAVFVACGKTEEVEHSTKDDDFAEASLREQGPLPDRQAPDAGVPPDACTPNPIGFTPEWHPPSPFHQNKCTRAQLEHFIECGRTGGPECKAWVNATENAECIGCALTNLAETPPPKIWGPIIVDIHHAAWVNAGGCIAQVTNDYSPTGCAARVQALLACRLYACNRCPLAAGANVWRDLDVCYDDAELTVCRDYLEAATCGVDLANGPAAICTGPDVSFGNDALDFVVLFCGPPDAGASDAATGG